jgi:hypothetical protein
VTSTPSSLVLGCATSLPSTYFEPFARSLRATGYQGRLGLVLGHYTDDDTRALEDLADFAVRVDAQYQAVSRAAVKALRSMRDTRRVRRAYPRAFSLVAAASPRRERLARWRALEYRLEGLQALRYEHYREIVTSAGPNVDQVFLTDVRDVFFQRDPFDPAIDGLEVYLEDPSVTLVGEPRNRKWIRDLYGRGELRAIGDQVVSCSGTVAGSRDAILGYLDAMAEEIERHRRPLGSHDQGVHNHLLRRGLLRSANIVANGHGRVLTMGRVAAFDRDDEGRVVNADGTVPAVLHQYDRHTSFATELIASLGPSD